MSAALKDVLVHGVYTTYRNHACRCKKCREAARLYMRQYRASGRADDWVFNRATRRASSRLADAHPDEYRQYYEEEKLLLRAELGR